MDEQAIPTRKFWQINLIGMKEESDVRMEFGAPMDNDRKNAYRWLLYHGMLEIRSHQVQMIQGSRWRFLNPFYLRRCMNYVQRSHAITEALHNLALFASKDFCGFKEDHFWKGIDSLKLFPAYWATDFRMEFHRKLSERRAEAKSP